MNDPTPQQILAVPMGENDADATTVRDYLVKLLAKVWLEGEGFDGKRPFGNSGRDGELAIALVRAGFVEGEIDEDGYLDGADFGRAEALVLSAIESLNGAVSAGTHEPVAGKAPAVMPEPDYLPCYPGKLAKPAAGLFERAELAEVTAERIATYFLDHCGNCRDAEFYGATGRQAQQLHAKHVPVVEDGHGPLSGRPCACKTCVTAGAVSDDA